MGINSHCQHGKFMCSSENLIKRVRPEKLIIRVISDKEIKRIIGEAHTLMANKRKKRERK